MAGASGRAADAVAANWKGRAYVRKYVVPHDADTVKQGLVRDAFTTCVTLWRSLSTTVKAWLDTYGVGYRISGFNVFMAKNRKTEQATGILKPVPDNPNVAALVHSAGSVAVATKITITWIDPTKTGWTKVFLCVRDKVTGVFSSEILTVLASAATYDFTGLTTGHIYRVYIALYNSTTYEFGTSSGTAELTVT